MAAPLVDPDELGQFVLSFWNRFDDVEPIDRADMPRGISQFVEIGPIAAAQSDSPPTPISGCCKSKWTFTKLLLSSAKLESSSHDAAKGAETPNHPKIPDRTLRMVVPGVSSPSGQNSIFG